MPINSNEKQYESYPWLGTYIWVLLPLITLNGIHLMKINLIYWQTVGSTGGKQRQDSNTTLFPLGQHKNQRTQVLDINDELKKKKILF